MDHEIQAIVIWKSKRECNPPAPDPFSSWIIILINKTCTFINIVLGSFRTTAGSPSAVLKIIPAQYNDEGMMQSLSEWDMSASVCARLVSNPCKHDDMWKRTKDLAL